MEFKIIFSIKCTVIFCLLVLCIFPEQIFCEFNAKFMITPKEQEALQKFRPLVKDLITHDWQTTDSYLVQWLKAKKLNVKDAVDMFKEAQNWRKENKIDTIASESFPEFAMYLSTFTTDGVDLEGRPVITTSLGKFDVRGLFLTGKRDKVIRFSRQAWAKAAVLGAERVYKSNGTQLDPRVTAVHDLNGFDLRKIGCISCFSFFTSNQRELDSFYPGLLAWATTINAPRLALPFIQTVVLLTPEEDRAKIRIFGTDRTEWTKYLQKIIPADQLTYQFGGTKKN